MNLRRLGREANKSADPKEKLMFGKSTILIVCLGLAAAACGSQSSGVQSTTPPATAQTTAVTASSTPGTTVNSPNATAISNSLTPGIRNACGFLEDSEVTAVQGAPVQSRTPNQQTTAGLVASQCYYTVISADKKRNLSVHLQVMEADPKTPSAVNEYWKNSFHSKSKEAREKDEDREKGKEGPQTVANLGDEAFWVDSGKTGVLYALRQRKLVRISVGGGVDSKDRLAKSKRLMVKALGRIS